MLKSDVAAASQYPLAGASVAKTVKTWLHVHDPQVLACSVENVLNVAYRKGPKPCGAVCVLVM